MLCYLFIVTTASLWLTVSSQIEIPFHISVGTPEQPPPPSCTHDEVLALRVHLRISLIVNAARYCHIAERDIVKSPDLVEIWNATNRMLRRSALLEDERRLAIVYKVVYAGTALYACKLCTVDNKDKLRQLESMHDDVDNPRQLSLMSKDTMDTFMSNAMTARIRIFANVTMPIIMGDKPSCLGKGKEVAVVFSLDT